MTQERSRGENRGGTPTLENDGNGAAENLTDKVSGYAESLREQAENGKDRAASGLEKAATEMRGKLEEGGGVQAQVGAKLADGMESTAGYLREHEASEIWSDLESFVKDHPVQAAVTAAVAGFLVARLVR